MKPFSPSAQKIDAEGATDAVNVPATEESLSDFVTQAAHGATEWPRAQDAFLKRAHEAVERSVRNGGGITPQELLKRMDERLDAAFARVERSKR